LYVLHFLLWFWHHQLLTLVFEELSENHTHSIKFPNYPFKIVSLLPILYMFFVLLIFKLCSLYLK
jgi:hypothetical protein